MEIKGTALIPSEQIYDSPESKIKPPTSSLNYSTNFIDVLDSMRKTESVNSLVSNLQNNQGGNVSKLKGMNDFSKTHISDNACQSLRGIDDLHDNPDNFSPKVEIHRESTKITSKNTIDKTSKLYEQAIELESYFVKIMLNSMRSTLSGKTLAGDESFAGKMYQDMMYDELGRNITKNANFGLADQIYLELYHGK